MTTCMCVTVVLLRSESFEQALEHDVLNGQPPSGPAPRQRSGTGRKTKKKNKKKETEPSVSE